MGMGLWQLLNVTLRSFILRKHMKLLLTLLVTLFSLHSFAGPSVFSLELGVTDVSQFKSKYRHSYIGLNKYSQGEMYEVSPSQIEFKGLKEVTVIFNKNQVLAAVLTTFNKNKFDYLHKALSNKYQVKSRVIPFVGNKAVEYHHENSVISLEAPHMSFELSLNYLTTDFMRKFKSLINQEDRDQRNKEINQL